MKKGVLMLSLLLATTVAICAGCKRKPAYSDIDTNRSGRSENRNAETATAQPEAAQPEATESTPAPPPPPASSQTPPQTNNFKLPTFIDDVEGDIKDLPFYPGSYRTGGRIGPSGEANLASFSLDSGDSMDKIAAFYERVVKTNRWKVVEKLIDPELSKWTLVKGQDDSAKVEVKKDPQSGRMTILLVRGEPLKPAK